MQLHSKQKKERKKLTDDYKLPQNKDCHHHSSRNVINTMQRKLILQQLIFFNNKYKENEIKKNPSRKLIMPHLNSSRKTHNMHLVHDKIYHEMTMEENRETCSPGQFDFLSNK